MVVDDDAKKKTVLILKSVTLTALSQYSHFNKNISLEYMYPLITTSYKLVMWYICVNEGVQLDGIY